MNNVSLTKVNGKWAVTLGGDSINGLKPFTVERDTGTINQCSDFKLKKDALNWIKDGFPISEQEKSMGISQIVWAKNLKEARKVSEFKDSYLSQDVGVNICLLETKVIYSD